MPGILAMCEAAAAWAGTPNAIDAPPATSDFSSVLRAGELSWFAEWAG
ncbi:hypothetical protein [Burkholderia gladioli]|nr:hypothetical protein [Burkholderia gladioli]